MHNVKTKIFISVFVISFFLVMTANLVHAQENSSEKYINCSDQLDLLLESYNDLVSDIKNGTTCGTLNSMLKEGNAKLSENLEVCKESINLYKKFKLGFYLMLSISLICIIYMFYIIKLNKQEEVKK